MKNRRENFFKRLLFWQILLNITAIIAIVFLFEITLQAVGKTNTETTTDELFIIGGAQIYAQAMQQNLADRLLITHVKRDFEADAFFPEIGQRHWQEVWRESHHDTASGLDFDFVDYRKVV